MMEDNKKIFVTKSSMPTYEEFVRAIKPLWDSHWLTNMGIYHKQLEDELREFLDVPFLSLTVNGHMGLELAIQSFNFPEGSEVITTPFTFISTTHAIVRNRLKPVFCDVKESDGTIDEEKIEELITENTVAIMPVHVYGNICNVERIEEIAYKYGLKVIYDAAHAFGEKLDGVGIGNFGDAAVFSFHATKVFNTIEGGGVCLHSKEQYEKLYNLKNFGIRGEELVVEVGANAKMNEFAAIMGLCNMKHLSSSIESRKQTVDYYNERLHNVAGIKFLEPEKGVENNYAYYPILITDKYKKTRDAVYDELRANEIYPRKYFYPITSDQACFRNRYRNTNLSVARKLSQEVLVLPLYEGLEKEDADRIVKAILK